MAVAVLSFAIEGRRLRHRRLHRRSSLVRHAEGFQRSCARRTPRAAGDHRTGAEPHLRSASVVSALTRAAPGSRWRDFYVWSDTPEKYKDARIIFKDFETSNWTWDPVAKAYYWHRFYSHQPDLNFDNPEVAEAMFARHRLLAGHGRGRIAAGRRARISIEREGTNCENLPETHSLPARTCASTSTRISRPHAAGRSQPMAGGCRRLFRQTATNATWRFIFRSCRGCSWRCAWKTAFRSSISCEQTPAIPETCQWAMFLRNHDELTLEMVTDEERDYMYRVYASDATSADQSGHSPPAGAAAGERSPPKIELMNALLFSLPGHAGDLLRRRNRHGRQHLSGRPQWRPHADAVERRPQRRLLARQSAAAVSAGHYRSRNITTKRSTSRRSRTIRTRCCGG